jgi:hypothetical protein
MTYPVPASGCSYVDNICNLLTVSLLVNCVVSKVDNKLRDVIPLVVVAVVVVVVVSGVPVNGCLYVNSMSHLLVVSLLANCDVLRDDNKLRGVILSVTNDTGCSYVDNIPILLVVLLVNRDVLNLSTITELVLFESTLSSNISIKVIVVIPLDPTHVSVTIVIPSTNTIMPSRGIGGSGGVILISPTLPSVPSSD